MMTPEGDMVRDAPLAFGGTVEGFILLPLILVIPATTLLRMHVRARLQRMAAGEEPLTDRSLRSLLRWKRALDVATVACLVLVVGMVLVGLVGLIGLL